jgi:hypothetical protein
MVGEMEDVLLRHGGFAGKNSELRESLDERDKRCAGSSERRLGRRIRGNPDFKAMKTKIGDGSIEEAEGRIKREDLEVMGSCVREAL